jgi:cytochrome P450
MKNFVITNKSIAGPNFFSFIKKVRANPVLYCYDLMKQYGDVVRCPSLEDIYLISNPILAKEVFLNAHKLFDKNNFINNRMREVMGNGVVLTNGAEWKRQRQGAQVVFKKEALRDLRPEVLHQVNKMIVRWKNKASSKQAVNIHEEIRTLVMAIMAGCLFRLNDEELLKQLKAHFWVGNEYVSDPMPFNLPAWVPMTRKAKLDKTLKYIDTILLRMMAEQALTGKHEGRLLSFIMDQRDDTGNQLTKEAVLAEAKNIFVSGYFSTSDVLSWLVYSLAQYPEWQDKVFDECKVFEDCSDPDVMETAVQTQHFIHEVLRCYPPVWASSHHTLQPLNLGDYRIPGNVTVMVSIFNVQRHPSFWNEPDVFNPDRFKSSNELLDKAMFIPFGMGPRKCLGMGLARMVINTVFIKLVANFRLSVMKQIAPAIQSRVTLGAKQDLQLFIEPR